ncbi:hypothetical protein BH11MYX3_BH11MYX3_43300 [soil metagenome]
MKRTSLMLVTVAALNGCGKETATTSDPVTSSPSTPAAAAAGGKPAGSCEVTVTGDYPLTYTAIATKGAHPNAKAMAASDYWMSEDELRQGLKMMNNVFDGKKLSDAEIEKRTDEDMKKDPRFYLLLLNCSNDSDGTVSLGAIGTYADVPYKAGKYVIAAQSSDKPGEFSAMTSVRKPEYTSFRVAEPGEIVLTKFDATGIAGTFSYKAQTSDKSKSVIVHGTFDYPCTGTSICK